MPTVTDKKLPKRQTYPWEKWLKSAGTKAAFYEAGKDFQVSVSNFVSNAYGFAVRNKLVCTTNRSKDGKGVYLQFAPDPTKKHKHGPNGQFHLTNGKPGRPPGSGTKPSTSATTTAKPKAKKKDKPAKKPAQLVTK